MTPSRAGLAIAALWLAWAASELSAHGLGLDSSTLFYAGDRTLWGLEHPGHPEALAFGRTPGLPDLPGFHSDFSPYFPEPADPIHYPVLPGLVAALSAQVSGPLGLSNVDGHHLGLVLLHAVGLFCFTRLAMQLLGALPGLFAALSLLTLPEAVGLAFNNAKDWPCADFYACAVLAGATGLIGHRRSAGVVAGLFAGLALSCKINGAFALVLLGGLGLWATWQRSKQRRRLDLSALGQVAAMAAIALATFFVLWPYLYSGPVAGWGAHLEEYFRFFANYARGPRETWTDYPLRPLLFSTPLPLLVAAVVGGLEAGRALLRQGDPDRQALSGLLLAWVGLALLRPALPHSNFYDGNRHFLEYQPGLCALAGLSLARGWEWLSPRIGRRWPKRVAALPLAGAATWGLLCLPPLLRYRPFEATYFNALAGGLGGAQSAALYAMPDPHDHRVRGSEGDYWYGAIGDGFPRLAALLERDPGRGFGLCGPAIAQALGQWPEARRRLRPHADDQSLLYLAPREIFCGLQLIRQEEARRPLLDRTERGGGLIDEILGPVDGQPHPVVTRPSVYEADPSNRGAL